MARIKHRNRPRSRGKYYTHIDTMPLIDANDVDITYAELEKLTLLHMHQEQQHP